MPTVLHRRLIALARAHPKCVCSESDFTRVNEGRDDSCFRPEREPLFDSATRDRFAVADRRRPNPTRPAAHECRSSDCDARITLASASAHIAVSLLPSLADGGGAAAETAARRGSRRSYTLHRASRRRCRAPRRGIARSRRPLPGQKPLFSPGARVGYGRCAGLSDSDNRRAANRPIASRANPHPAGRPSPVVEQPLPMM